MIHLQEIDTTRSEYAFVENLWLQAFPEIERRDTSAQRQNIDGNPIFHCLLATDESAQPVGFITYWDFATFCYIEHFSTLPSLRNHGYGAQILSALFFRVPSPFVLEVEYPQDELSRRRIRFYERNGLSLWQHIPYIQPAYRPGGQSLPMHLMATADLDPSRHAAHIIATIHSRVYGC